MKLIIQLRVSKSKEEKSKLKLRVSNSKFNLIFYEVELVTRKKNFCKNFGVSNSKCNVILGNSVFVTREFQSKQSNTYFILKGCSALGGIFHTEQNFPLHGLKVE